ncbi:RNA pseudouridylate synthase domain-containing protein 1-like [Daktulosphaira vitifoliae]|uniref:RNA pseudouridylate synthase domain-containing protein 1-like n=1 Tax=Daktulosphaira vitifoliae TaxID=58002 RepID=UPI0021A9C12B|nr:RNA pseudouridylate synthase domain-containing protein 1-like [Daktulosphaira vitifoliae]
MILRSIFWCVELFLNKIGFLSSSHIEIEVLYESSDYLIVNKPEDVYVNNHFKEKPSLDLLLSAKYPHLVNNNLEHSFYFVHRLDFVTSGVICIALNKKACAAASNRFQKRTSKKFYLALLRGHVSVNNLELTKSIGYCSKEISGNHKMCTAENLTCIKPRFAHTKLVVIERGIFMSYPATKVILQLVTGRRHQIRVHCSEIGHTIVGDFTYSNRKDITPHRTFLHSYMLNLHIDNLKVQTDDPFTEEKLNGLWKPIEFITKLNDFNTIEYFS